MINSDIFLTKHIRKIDNAARVIDGNAFEKRGLPGDRIIKRRQIAARKAADILRAEFHEQAKLVDEIEIAQRQVDGLMGTVISHDHSFVPSQSEIWPDFVRRAALLRCYGRT